MNRTRFWASTIIACLVLIVFFFSVPRTHAPDVKHAPLEESAAPTVTLHDSFKKGVHTLKGSYTVPNSCTPLSASATLAGDASSTQQRILLAITYETQPGICLELPTAVPFGVTLSAPANLPLDVTVNGAVATTTSS